MKVAIPSRFGGKALYETDIPDDTPERLRIRAALTIAIAARADLTGADLTDADLTGARLAGARLARARLARADLTDADLADANLARANLAGAYLASAKEIIDGGNLPWPCGYRWVAVKYKGRIMIAAGCRWQSIEEREADVRRRYSGLALTVRLNAIAYIRSQAEALGWLEDGSSTSSEAASAAE